MDHNQAFILLLLASFVDQNMATVEYSKAIEHATMLLWGNRNDPGPDLRPMLADDNFESNVWRLLQRNSAPEQLFGLTDGCNRSVAETLDAMKAGQPWALSMLDATSKIESGILEGNIFWPGSFSQCLRVEAVKYSYAPTTPDTTSTGGTTSTTTSTTRETTSQTLDVISNAIMQMVGLYQSDTTGYISTSADVTRDTTAFTGASSEPTTPDIIATHLFDGQHCSVYIRNLSNPKSIPTAITPGISVGVCIPDTCTQNDSIALVAVDALSTFIARAPAVLSQLPKKQIWPLASNCHTNEGYPLDAAAIGTIVMLSVLGFILLVATLYDIVFLQMSSVWPCGQHKRPLGIDDTPETDHNETIIEYTSFDNRVDESAAAASGQRGWLPMLMVRLSMYSNGAKLLNTDRNPASLDCLHGIRFISMTWVILGHTYVFTMLLLRNPAELYYTVGNFAMQAIMNATVSVDTFFLLSGTLVSYLLLKELKKKEGPKHVNWAMYYFHRFWRLTPPYMIVLGAHTALFKYLGNGPFWTEQGADPKCTGSWWANLIYLNNVIPNHMECMAWGWYLANDMQFYILSPLFVVALHMKRIVGIAICSLALFGSTLTYAVITQVNDYPAEIVDAFSGKTQENWNTDIYYAPWCRIGPYIIGLLLGYILVETDRKVRVRWYLSLLGWAVATGVAIAVLYGLYHVANGHPLTTPVAAFYASVHRTLWAVAVAWVIFACVCGMGGPVNTLLSWQPFIPLSRLTYMAYLIHPVVMAWYCSSRRVPFYFDQSTQVWLFLGFLTVSYGLAFVFSLAFEAPMMGLEKVIFFKKRPKD